MKYLYVYFVVVFLLGHNVCSFTQQEVKDAKHLIKFSFGGHLNSVLENTKSYERPTGFSIFEKGNLRSTIGKKMGVEWEWLFARKWSLQSGVFLSHNKINFADYEANNLQTWKGKVIVVKIDQEPGFATVILSHEKGNAEIDHLNLNIPIEARYYLINKRLFLEAGIHLQKRLSASTVRDYTKTVFYSEREEVDASTGQVNTVVSPLSTPIETQETDELISSPSPIQLLASGGLGTRFPLFHHFHLEAKVHYEYFLKEQYYFYYWKQTNQVGLTLSLILPSFN